MKIMVGRGINRSEEMYTEAQTRIYDVKVAEWMNSEWIQQWIVVYVLLME